MEQQTMEWPLISIAMATYNGEKYIKQQIDSIINQSYKNIELVICDDCSSDDTLTILNDYENKCNFIHVYENSEKLGFVKNFEKAISLCSGE